MRVKEIVETAWRINGLI